VKVVIQVTKDNSFVLREEAGKILSGVMKGVLQIPFPPPKNEWCQCKRCGKWHKTG
jgi:hypothetical protein